MSVVYVMSDLHLTQPSVIKFRSQFPSHIEHDELIIDNILTICKKRDTLWLLGDCFIFPESIKLLAKMKQHIGYIHLVLGNHDTDRERYKNIVLPIINQSLVDSVHGVHKMKGKAWMTHTPMHPQELYGKINIHGHVHSNTIPDDRYCNVSCENTDYKPVKLQDIYGGWRYI